MITYASVMSTIVMIMAIFTIVAHFMSYIGAWGLSRKIVMPLPLGSISCIASSEKTNFIVNLCDKARHSALSGNLP